MRLVRAVNGLVLGLVLAQLAAASPALATEYHGQVMFGGLPVPGTQVKVTATQGSKTVTAITDDQGIFSFPDLTDGSWTLSIEMTGFAPLKQEITVAPNAPVVSFELKLLPLDQIRAATHPVKIEPGAAQAVAANVAPAVEAPVTGKGAAAATKAAAAKEEQANAAPAPEAPAPQAAPDSNAQASNDGFLINGSVNNAATSQFSLSQAFGNARGSRSLYNFGLMLRLDNSVLDAKNYSVTGLDSPKDPYNNLIAGFQVQGPLKIPGLLPLSRAPTVYLGYQRTQSTSESTPQALVPTSAEVGGNLAALPGLTGQIYVPTSGLQPGCTATPGAAFPTNSQGQYIPASCISPVAQALLLKFYPAPNATGISQYNYQIPLASDTHQDSYTARLQKQFGSKDYVSGIYSLQSTRISSPNLFGFVDTQDNLGMSVNPSWSHRFTQRLSMNASYNFNRQRNDTTIPFEKSNENVSNLVGINGNDQDRADYGPPALSFAQSGIYGLSDGNSRNNRNETNSVSLDVHWNRFRHNMTFGGDFRRQEYNYFQQSNPRGSLSFTGAATQTTVGGVASGGSDFADFLLGLPDTSQIAFGNADKYLRQSVYDLYANDDFRVSPELSINYGVRWEYGAPMTELKNRLVNLDVAPGFTAETPVLASNPVGTLSGQNYPTSLLRPDKIGAAPTVALAWRPISGSSLLVRSSYGIYHDTSNYQATAYAMAQQTPGLNAPWISTSLSVPNSPTCRFTIASPFAALPCSSTTPDSFAVDPNFRVGYVQTWFLSLARDLPAALQLTVSYTGIKGTRGVQEFLPNTYPVGAANPCPSCPSGYFYRTSNGNSTKELGSVQLRRRLRAGFLASATYTYSKALDDDYSYGGGASVASSGSSQVAQDWRNPAGQRGLSTFDQRNVLAVQLQYTTGMGLGGRSLMGGWRGAIYKEWTVLANVNVASGLPETPIDFVSVPGSADTDIIRANYVGGAVHLHQPDLFLNPAAFTAPASGQWGTAARDSITGPQQFSLNASMNRAFRLHDRYNLTAQIDANNVLNHVTFSSWNNTIGPLFGTVASANGMRSLAVTLRLRY